MLIHSKGCQNDCPLLNDANDSCMAIIENHQFKTMARHASSNRIHIVLTYEVNQLSVQSESVTAELCPERTAAAKANGPATLLYTSSEPAPGYGAD